MAVGCGSGAFHVAVGVWQRGSRGVAVWQSGRGSVAVGAWQRGRRGVAVGRGSAHCHVAGATATPYCHAHCHVAGATATPLPHPTATPYCHTAPATLPHPTATLPHPDCHTATPRLPRCHAPTATLPHPECHVEGATATPHSEGAQFHTGTPKLAQHVALNMYVCASALPFLAKKCKQEGLVNRSVIT